MIGNVMKQAWVAVVALAMAGGFAFAEDAKKDAAAEAKDDYPLTVCVVSGEKLGEMGEPHVIQHEGREVRFCCASCEDTFNEDPAKYLKKIDEAAAAAAEGGATTQPSTQPSDGEHHGHEHHDGDDHHDDHDKHDGKHDSHGH